MDRPDCACRQDLFLRRRKAEGPDYRQEGDLHHRNGRIYDAQTRMASFNFVEPYLRSVFGFLGVTDATFLTAGGTSVLNQGHDRNAFLAPHLQAVQTHARTF